MGNVVLNFEPRKNLQEFAASKGKIGLLRRTGGRKSTQNMVILGENLATLCALRAGFGLSGKNISVDVIYIDPPYNVGGNQGYKNDFRGKSQKERDWAGDHGAFLDFMEPRLKIGKQVLSDEGVIFVSICDGEYCRLKILMDMIFGESNLIGTFIWDKGRGAAGSHMTTTHEYVIVYAKNKQKLPVFSVKKESAEKMIQMASSFVKNHKTLDDAQKAFNEWVSKEKKAGKLKPGEAAYSQIHPESKRLFHADNSCAQDDPSGKRCRKPLIHPKTKKVCPVPANGWKWAESTLDEHVENKRIWFGKDHTVVPKIIRYLDEYTETIPLSIIFNGNDGKRDLPTKITFTTPKPVSLIKYLLSLYPKKNAMVLDYFAGSGATAQAVHELNEDDGGNRNWIMVEEMGTTYEKVLIPRLDKTAGGFATFELETIGVGGNEIIRLFREYSKDFLSAFHAFDEKNIKTSEGLSVLGVDPKTNQLVAMTIPSLRKGKDFFRSELALLRAEALQKKAKSILIYTVRDDKMDEPWRGNDKNILAGTGCSNLSVVEIPKELVQRWAEALDALLAFWST